MDRTINFGDDAADARYRIQDTSSTGGDFVLAEDLDGGTVLLEYDYSASEWVSRGPVNLDGNDITNAGSITADTLEAKEVKSNLIFASEYNTVQNAIDAVPTDTNGFAQRQLFIGAGIGEINENLKLNKNGMKVESGGNTLPYIKVDGNDHAVEITGAEDIGFKKGRVAQTGSGNYDAVHVAAQEARIHDIDHDGAPRYAHNITADRVQSTGLQMGAGDVAALHTASGTNRCRIEADINGPPADGAVIDGNTAIIDLNVAVSNGDNCIVNGDGNVIKISSFGATGNELTISGSDNVVVGRFGGDILLETDSENNKVVGSFAGSLTDNGTNNDTSDLV